MPRKAGYVTEQAMRLTRGQINRRRFIMSAVSAGVTLPTATSLANRAEASAPRIGGLFRQAVSTERGYRQAFNLANANTLLQVKRDGTLSAGLAEEFSFDKSGKIWRFKLRPDVSFHSGKKLNVEDVVHSLNRHRGTSTGLLSGVEEIKTFGQDTVEVRFEHNATDFGKRLADDRISVRPIGSDTKCVDGTGPYKIMAGSKSPKLHLVRNEAYWKTNAAHFDAVEISHLRNTTLRHGAIMGNDVDYASDIDPRAVALIKSTPSVDIHEMETTRCWVLAFDLTKTPFQNAHLRRALSRLMPREDMVSKILLGHGQIGEDTPALGSPEASGFDLALAADALRLSGHKGPVTVSLPKDGFPGAKEALSLMISRAETIGLHLDFTENKSTGLSFYVAQERPNCAAIVPAQLNQIVAHSSKLGLPKTPKLVSVDGTHNAAETWWFLDR